MNKAITDGLVLTPPAFASGLDVWSSGDGTQGSPTYQGASNAALVPADQDFGGALELVKTDNVQKLRYMGETPLLPGCYLRIRARVKAISGNLPAVRIAAWAGGAGGAHVAGVTETGPATQLTTYGEVVTVEAIVSTATRTGVDMPWGTGALFGHFGLDLTGPNGGVVRIDDIEIEDATSVFLRDMMDWVDVRDYGAIGDGVTNDRAAFAAADAAAGGRWLLVPAGSYRIASSLTIHSRIRFQGTLTMPVAARLSLMQNFDLPTYIEAFGGDEELAFRKAVQALMNFTDHEGLDLGGRRIQLSGPIDVHAAVDNKDVFQTRRVIRNGQFDAQPSSAWDDDVVTSAGTYDISQPTVLTNVANVAQVPVGALVTGNGVGREVYVTSKNVNTGKIFLSQQLHDAVGTQTYTFTRFQYLLDFSGFSAINSVALDNIEFQCNGHCSGVMLAPAGMLFQIRDCFITKPKDRGVTSIGRGCQDLHLERNQFISSEQSETVQNRSSIAFNVNANDAKIRGNRASRFAHFGVMHGTGHLIEGNHFFGGDDVQNGTRKAGLILTRPNAQTTINANYIDNCFIEWGNEHDAQPDHSNEFSFGGLTVTGNTCVVSRVGAWFRWFLVKPYGPGHYIHGLTLSGNVFRTFSATVDRIETVDSSIAPLDLTRMRNIEFAGNTFSGVTQFVANPVVQEHVENTAQSVWNVDFQNKLPFGGRARVVSAVVPEGPITGGGGAKIFAQPYAVPETGPGGSEVQLHWPQAVSGRVQLTARMDNPL